MRRLFKWIPIHNIRHLPYFNTKLDTLIRLKWDFLWTLCNTICLMLWALDSEIYWIGVNRENYFKNTLIISIKDGKNLMSQHYSSVYVFTQLLIQWISITFLISFNLLQLLQFLLFLLPTLLKCHVGCFSSFSFATFLTVCFLLIFSIFSGDK